MYMITMQYHRYLGTVGVYTHTHHNSTVHLYCRAGHSCVLCREMQGESRIQNLIAWWGD